MKLLEELKNGTKLLLEMPFIALITVPFMVYKFVIWPFEKPMQLSTNEAATFLRRCIDGNADDDELDYFSSVDIADARLDDLMKKVGKLFGPGWPPNGPLSPDTRKALEELLERVEAMPEILE